MRKIFDFICGFIKYLLPKLNFALGYALKMVAILGLVWGVVMFTCPSDITVPLTPERLILQYGALALIATFILAFISAAIIYPWRAHCKFKKKGPAPVDRL
jgi:hypothetical protein